MLRETVLENFAQHLTHSKCSVSYGYESVDFFPSLHNFKLQ